MHIILNWDVYNASTCKLREAKGTTKRKVPREKRYIFKLDFKIRFEH